MVNRLSAGASEMRAKCERDESQTTSEENEKNKSDQARRLPPTAPATAPRYS